MRESFIKFIRKRTGQNELIITCGLPCTCKTGVANEIAKITGYPIVSSDLLRKEVLKGEDIFDAKIASNMNKRLMVYDKVFQQAEEQLQKGNGVIIDATFIKQALRKRVAAIAAQYGRTLLIFETRSPREIAISRILKRNKEDYESNAITEEAYVNNERLFEKVNIDDLKSSFPGLSIIRLAVDTRYDKANKWYIIDIEQQ